NTGRVGKQIAAAGECAVQPHTLTGNHPRNLGGRLILRNIAGFKPRYDNLGNAGSLERGDLGSANHGAFLENKITLAYRVHGRGAERVVRRNRTELHAATDLFCGLCRSRAVISPIIATAISAGDTALISSPIGA